MAAGIKVNALDPLVLPVQPTDNLIIGRGTQSFRTPVTTKPPVPLLVAVVDSGTHRCAVSNDPLDFWETAELPRYLNFSEGSWSDVIYVPERRELWAVAALNGGTNRNVIAVSRDGYRWSGRSNDANTVNTGIAYAPSLGLFCVTRTTGSTTSMRLWTSTNGMDWTERALPVASVTLDCIAWSPTLSLFCAMGATNAVYTSPDGINWTQRTGPTSGGSWRRVIWAGGTVNRFIAFDGNNIGRSSDGINWGAAINGNMPGNGRGLAFSPTLNVAVITDGNNNGRICHSTDGGATWVIDNVTGPWTDVVWSAELAKFVAVGWGVLNIATSPDGDNWTIQPSSYPHSSGAKRMVATR